MANDIQRLANGAINTNYYLQRGRQLRAEQYASKIAICWQYSMDLFQRLRSAYRRYIEVKVNEPRSLM